jgi:hypothetical protein
VTDYDHDYDHELDERLRAYGQRWREQNPIDREPGEFLAGQSNVGQLDDVGSPVHIGSSRRRLRTWAMAAAAVVLLAGGGSLLAVVLHSTNHPVATLPAPTCPASVETDVRGPLTVPAPGVATNGHLVPEQIPGAAVVCTYTFHDVNTPGQRQVVILTGSLDRAARQLYRTPVQDSSHEECPANIPMNTTIHVLGLAYKNGDVWIAVDDWCAALTTNGSGTYGNIFPTLTQAAKLGTWPTK